MIQRLCLLLISISVICACQSNESSKTKEAAAAEVFDTATKPLVLSLYLRYLDRDKRLKSTANFYEQANGQKKGIELESDVLIEGRKMEFKNLRDIELRYEDLYDVPAKEVYNFTFNTFDGQTHNYEATIPLIKSFKVDGGIKKSAGFTLNAEASDLQTNEVLLMMFTDENRQTESINIFGPKSMSALSLSAEEIKNLSLGRNELRLVRKRAERIKEKNYSGECSTEYYSDAIIVEVEE